MINLTNNQSHNHAHLDTYVRGYLLAFEIETSITPHSVNFFWAICGSKSKTNARPQKYTRKQEASPAKFCVISTISFTYYPKDEMKKLLTCNLQYAITQETPTLRKSKQPLFYQITGPINLQSALSNGTGGTFYKLHEKDADTLYGPSKTIKDVKVLPRMLSKNIDQYFNSKERNQKKVINHKPTPVILPKHCRQQFKRQPWQTDRLVEEITLLLAIPQTRSILHSERSAAEKISRQFQQDAAFRNYTEAKMMIRSKSSRTIWAELRRM